MVTWLYENGKPPMKSFFLGCFNNKIKSDAPNFNTVQKAHHRQELYENLRLPWFSTQAFLFLQSLVAISAPLLFPPPMIPGKYPIAD